MLPCDGEGDKMLHTLALMWPTHTDKPQSMQESRRVLEMTRMATIPDSQEGSTRESELLVKATENPTEVIPPHIIRT